MQHGEIYMLKEIPQRNDLLYKCVRVTGTVAFSDARSKICQIYHKNSTLWIDTSLVDVAMFREDALCQIIGEIRPGSTKVSRFFVQ